MTENSRPQVKLDEWSLTLDRPNMYSAPEQATLRLQGKSIGHPRHKDGTNVSTSVVVELDVPNRVAKTLYSDYTLLAPSAHFLEWLVKNEWTLEDYKVYVKQTDKALN